MLFLCCGTLKQSGLGRCTLVLTVQYCQQYMVDHLQFYFEVSSSLCLGVAFDSCYSLECTLSFSGGSISASEVVRCRHVGFSSVCLRASPIDFNTAVTTIWHQKDTCWHNDDSLSFRFHIFCCYCAPPLSDPTSSPVSCASTFMICPQFSHYFTYLLFVGPCNSSLFYCALPRHVPSDVPTNPGHLTPTFSCTLLTSPADTPAPHYPISPSVFVCSCHLFPCYLFTTGLPVLPLWTLFACLDCFLMPDWQPLNLNLDLVKSHFFNLLCLSVPLGPQPYCDENTPMTCVHVTAA